MTKIAYVSPVYSYKSLAEGAKDYRLFDVRLSDVANKTYGFQYEKAARIGTERDTWRWYEDTLKRIADQGYELRVLDHEAAIRHGIGFHNLERDICRAVVSREALEADKGLRPDFADVEHLLKTGEWPGGAAPAWAEQRAREVGPRKSPRSADILGVAMLDEIDRLRAIVLALASADADAAADLREDARAYAADRGLSFEPAPEPAAPRLG